MILLKTLTEKSVITQGKFTGMKVGEIMGMNKSYLIFCYFSYDRITFTDNILDKLHIKEEDRIKKPGKDVSKVKYYINRNCFRNAQMISKTKDKTGIIKTMFTLKKNRNKAKYKALIEKEKIYFSKAAMQRRNQGKY